MDILLIINTLQTVLTVALIVAVGFLGVKAGILGEHTLKELSAYLIYIAVPCTIVAKLYGTIDIRGALYGVGITAVAQTAAVVIGYGLDVAFKVPKERRGVNSVAFGICNSGFIGLPIVAMLFGEEAKAIAIFFIISNNIVFWTLGAYLIKKDGILRGTYTESSEKFSLKKLSPPIVTFVVMLIINVVGLKLPNFIVDTVKILDETTAPAALIFCGTVLGGIGLKNIRWEKGFSLIMFGRYIVSPLVMALLFLVFPAGQLTQRVMIIQAAMPVVTLVEVGAKRYGGDVEYASLSFIYSLFMLAITLPITYYILMVL